MIFTKKPVDIVIDPLLQKVIQKYESTIFADSNIRESGHNRHPKIDHFCDFTHVPVGSPYCLAGLITRLFEVGSDLGVKFDLPKTAGTQFFWSHVKTEYKCKSPKDFCIGIFQSRSNPAHGHAVYVLGGLDAQKNFATFEYNTNSAGSRDGSSVMRSKRNIAGSSTLKLLGFVDLAKAIVRQP